jgi:hypothetical protein
MPIISGSSGGASSALASDKKTRTSGDVTYAATTFGVIDAALNITLTTGAHKCLVSWIVNAKNSTGSTQQVDVEIDGTRAGQTYGLVLNGSATNINSPLSGSYVTDALIAGSHTFKLMFRVDGGSSTVYASTTITPVVFEVVELYA